MGKPLTAQSRQVGRLQTDDLPLLQLPEEIERDAFMSEIAADRAVSIFNSSQTVSEETDVRQRVHLLARTMPQCQQCVSAIIDGPALPQADERPEWFSSLVQQLINNVLEHPSAAHRAGLPAFCTLLAAHLMADGYLIEDRAKSFVTAGETTHRGRPAARSLPGLANMLGTSPRYPAAG